MHFGCYSLPKVAEDPSLIYSLGNGLLTAIATGFELELPNNPTTITVGRLISEIAPFKTLQDNIRFAKQVLGTDAFDICTKWLQRSGAMSAVHGSFCDPTVAAPRQFDTLVITGGVANWMERRLAVAKRIDSDAVGQVLLPVGNRVMGVNEHPQVKNYAQTYDRPPAEWEYAEQFLVPALKLAGFGTIRVVPVENDSAAGVLYSFVSQTPELLESEHQTLVVGNAPNVVQSAGQLRLAARQFDKAYDYRGSQLFMTSDAFLIGVDGQPAWQAQNPLSGLGQILRLYKVLLENAELAIT